MSNIINMPFNKSKNPIINKLKMNKEVYFELDEKIKYDYSLIKEIFNEFKYDLSFLEKVLNDINNNVKEDWVLEFNIQYVHLLEKQKQYNVRGYLANDPIMSADLKINVYKITISMQSKILMDKLENAINNENANVVGMGFIVVQEMFSYSEVLKNYYAEEFIRKIFQNPNLENYLHQNFKTFEDIEKSGLTTFIINYITKKDDSLAYYVINHPQVLGEINYALECIKENWQHYIKLEENDIFTEIGEELFKYIHEQKNIDIENDMSDTIERIWEAAYYAAYKLGIFKSFYTQVVGYDPEYLKKLEKDLEILNFEDKSISFKKDYELIKNMMQLHLNQITDLNSQLILSKKDDKKQ